MRRTEQISPVSSVSNFTAATRIRKAGVCLPEHTAAHPGRRQMPCSSFADVRLLGDKLELDIQQLTDVRTPLILLFVVLVTRYAKQNTKCGDYMMYRCDTLCITLFLEYGNKATLQALAFFSRLARSGIHFKLP
jgi:hypothetical protein